MYYIVKWDFISCLILILHTRDVINIYVVSINKIKYEMKQYRIQIIILVSFHVCVYSTVIFLCRDIASPACIFPRIYIGSSVFTDLAKTIDFQWI